MAPTEADDFSAVLDTVLSVLDREEITYMMTGAIVRNVFGEVRTSRDLDVVIHPDDAHADALRGWFETQGLEVDGPRRGELGRRLVIASEPVPRTLQRTTTRSARLPSSR